MKWLTKRDLFSSLHSIHCDQLGLVYYNENIYVMIVLIILQNITVQWY